MNIKKILEHNNIPELQKELLALFKEQFNLKIQLQSGQLKQTHLLKKVRRNIARIKTILLQKNIK
ncbi:50S ribosomal protein L29 [Enterobacteriaceae endosymbiont of Macroplea mutica]|uniref:50S ribosomal protein L29 n=1 Tax=Enterobacteriaceae endosymbiont of Macroplea mutica TaxID=2675791 RepID=UPI00144A20B2|nr:50S ribosomal protein L29 [Enterobacteriaceae endosymbiont of Macroplea mutica]QJC31291.1 50S ribosomal protein L29 [Enterobacteriaceae endosymbiont of Macroplea mutica]